MVSRILNGRQPMPPRVAEIFAEALNVPLSEVLERADMFSETPPKKTLLGLDQDDASLWKPKASEPDSVIDVANAIANSAEAEVWVVHKPSMVLEGIMPGDFVLASPIIKGTNPKPGDTVIARVNDWKVGDARNVLRRYEPPVLVAASTDRDYSGVFIVDGNNVDVLYRIIASWRT